MAYADVADVQALISTISNVGVTIDGASTPSETAVASWLDQVAAEINGVLAALGYTIIPATGVNDVLLLRRYNAEKVAAMTIHAAYGFPQEPPARVVRWEKDYADFLNRLRQGQQALVDQALTSAGGLVIGSIGLQRDETWDTEFSG